MADPRPTPAPQPKGATGVVAFADGRVAWGQGFGAEGAAVGELCFNTAMTGYQEVMTDPSYAKQVIAFTFPHIGNVGANEEDVEAGEAHALGAIVREVVTGPSNYRSGQSFAEWMAANDRIGIAGMDTRALTRLVRKEGPPTIVIAHRADGKFDIEALTRMAAEWPGLEGMDLAKDVSREQVEAWSGGKWRWGQGYDLGPEHEGRPHVVAVDYGNKRNIFRNLVEAGARVTVVPASASFEEIMSHEPDGFFLSNGPGDPAATGEYAIPVIRQMLDTEKPLFGICLGHQLLALAVGGKTSKMFQGHRGANHPVKRLADGAVEITSMNHGFAVERSGLPNNVRETHVSLFDGSNCGIELTDRPAFSVQYHPEASPGPMDSFYLFEKFVGMMRHSEEGANGMTLIELKRELLRLPEMLREEPEAFTTGVVISISAKVTQPNSVVSLARGAGYESEIVADDVVRVDTGSVVPNEAWLATSGAQIVSFFQNASGSEYHVQTLPKMIEV